MKNICIEPILSGTEAKAKMQELRSIIAELSETLREENSLLRLGMPVSESLQRPRRRQLSVAYAKTWHYVKANGWHEDDAIADEIDELFAAASDLDALARENARHLNAAVQASQRRIEAVMGAIHDQESTNSPYTAAANSDVMIPSRHSIQV